MLSEYCQRVISACFISSMWMKGFQGASDEKFSDVKAGYTILKKLPSSLTSMLTRGDDAKSF